MKPESALKEFANEIASKISRKTISELQKITDTLSGDDSELTNVWDEICVQVQYVDSPFWDVYDEDTRSFVAIHVDKLKEHEKFSLWLQTSQGLDWLFDWIYEDEIEEPSLLFDDEDVVYYIVQEYIYCKAGEWSNERIRAYLERQP